MSDQAVTVGVAFIAALIGGGSGGFVGAWYKTRTEAAVRLKEIEQADRIHASEIQQKTAAHDLEIRRYEDERLEQSRKYDDERADRLQERRLNLESQRLDALYDAGSHLERLMKAWTPINHRGPDDPLSDDDLDMLTAIRDAMKDTAESIVPKLQFFGYGQVASEIMTASMQFASMVKTINSQDQASFDVESGEFAAAYTRAMYLIASLLSATPQASAESPSMPRIESDSQREPSPPPESA